MGDVIHSLTNADFTGFTYNQIFTSSATTVTLNGTSITITPPMKLDIHIRTCTSASSNAVFLVGMRKQVMDKGPIDILTGLPILNG